MVPQKNQDIEINSKHCFLSRLSLFQGYVFLGYPGYMPKSAPKCQPECTFSTGSAHAVIGCTRGALRWVRCTAGGSGGRKVVTVHSRAQGRSTRPPGFNPGFRKRWVKLVERKQEKKKLKGLLVVLFSFIRIIVPNFPNFTRYHKRFCETVNKKQKV